ncbi:alpha/beta hydrolase [Rhodovulum sp. 12E13]|uniref:alpha/beta hydrolase n=1 Tax=Rhodovulum sp. 12E13 TaxID=2203891 RepID=UPI000E183013|nr:alpha/beta hydrolase [Rhodovulum sp. 12E13]RDC74114.1 alpha/beta hydrolase [Rhodovulum sp. 12E13]
MIRLFRLALAWLLLLAACSGPQLADKPNVHAGPAGYPAAEVAPSARTVQPEIWFVTDRARLDGAPPAHPYGSGRSAEMTFGKATVQFGEGLDWLALVARSGGGGEQGAIPLRPVAVTERVRFPPTPLPFDVVDGRVRTLPEAQAAWEAQAAAFRAEIAAALARTERREVTVYVHGVATTFEEAQGTLANLWHWAGRPGLPLLYSWPSGNTGFFGYFRDREAGEFTIFHLKQTLRMRAATPGLDRINVIAHSRGTDVATSALRELAIAERAAGRVPRRSLKLGTLILSAPDLDFGIMQQRLVAEQFGPALDRINVYINPGDGPLGLAQTLLSGQRFGRIRPEDLTEPLRETFSRIGNVHFIGVEEARPALGHTYFRDNPAVVSDIVLALRHRAPPGGELRPMRRLDVNFWSLHRDYPAPPEPRGPAPGD